jgi:hypothetical protein
MQNLFHDGGFSLTGVSEAVINSIVAPLQGESISE